MTIETTLLEQAYVTEESLTPSAPTNALAGAGAGNVDNGTHSYKVTYTTGAGETAASAVGNTTTVADKTMNGKITVTLPAISTTLGDASYGATGWKVYRTAAGNAVPGPWLLVAAVLVAAGVSYTDNLADSGLGAAAPSTSTAGDGITGYGNLTAPASTDAFRHQELSLTQKLNREPSPEKRGTPDRSSMLPRRPTAAWDLGTAFWEPSGTLGTPSYITKFLRNMMGARTAPALATTIASGGSSTGAVLTSAGTLAVGDTVVVTLPTGRREITRIKTLATATVTWDELSQTPATGAAVVSGVNYKPTNTHPTSLSIFKFHTAGGFKEAVVGAIVNAGTFMFDGSKEVGVKLSGPAGDRVRTGFSQPGAFTTVGTPASGLVGNFNVGANNFLVVGAEIALENNSDLRNAEIGFDHATAILNHIDFRNVKVSVKFYLEDARLLDQADAITTSVLRLVIGDTNGYMLGVVLPKVEFEIPDLPTTGGPKIVTIDGVAMGSDTGNDALFLGEH